MSSNSSESGVQLDVLKWLKNTLKVRTRSNKAVGTVSLPLSDKAVGTVGRKDNYKIIVLTADSKYNNPHPYKSYNLVDSVIGKPDGQLQNPHKKLHYLHLIRPTRIFEPRLEPKGYGQLENSWCKPK